MANPGDVAWIELPLRHGDGTIRWFEVGVTNRLDDPAVSGLVCNMRDVSERRAAQEQLKFQAYHDALTRLPNRWQFLERLEQALFDASTNGRYVAVLFLDVDRFKLVNDTLGHDIGDRLLVQVAERLADVPAARPTSSPASAATSSASCSATSATPTSRSTSPTAIVECLREPVMAGEHELFVSASIGIAISHEGQELASDLLRQADLAMYVAKENGRARWEVFDPQSAPHVMERLELEGDLWRAIDHGELVVQFQPEMELTTGRVVATEALIRWQHPTRGVIIARPVRAVRRGVGPHRRDRPVRVARGVPVGAAVVELRRRRRHDPADRGERQPLAAFHAPGRRGADIMRALDETGVDPRCIQIEITERSALTDLEVTSLKLHQLRALGVRVAIDDFGTGYSSLSYLKHLPIDVLKLDKSFLDSIDTVAADVAIVQAAITMGHALGREGHGRGCRARRAGRPAARARLRHGVGWLWSPAVPPGAARRVRDRRDSRRRAPSGPTRFSAPPQGSDSAAYGQYGLNLGERERVL